ncbi:MAG TPA: 23S rRNA (pseudouridine(1915)-N(3))-methyltransferase RlmH [Pyrinomonadaceae bacterium]|jgi:23S rRNA (pseudouridine1915-N3)-methyltransferase
MRLRFIWVGKTRNEHLRALCEEYLKRLKRFTRCEVVEVRESAAQAKDAGIEDEGRRILGGLHSDGLVVLLDMSGREWTSPDLAAQIEKWQSVGSVKEVAFVIGGHWGVSQEVMERAGVCWSLSRLTLTHEMARVLLVEQVYRAYTIMHGLPYQK